MKKTISLLFFACFAMLLVSCHKDGVYNPKKKISRIFETETTHYYDGNLGVSTDNNSGRQLREVWTWGKKTLDRIDYYYDNKLSNTQYFSYDKNRLVRVSDDDMYYTYKYDGRFLQQIDVYEDNVLEGTYKITHQKGKWSKIEVTRYDYDYKSGKGDRLMPLRFVLSDEICKSIKESEKKHYAKHGGKGTLSITYTLTWEKKNVSRMVENYSDGYTCTYTYKYDKKKNPYYGGFIGMEEPDMLLSENNVIQEDEQSEDGYYSYSYDYTYDGNWPSSRRSSYSRTYEWGSYSRSTLVEYEYQ